MESDANGSVIYEMIRFKGPVCRIWLDLWFTLRTAQKCKCILAVQQQLFGFSYCRSVLIYMQYIYWLKHGKLCLTKGEKKVGMKTFHSWHIHINPVSGAALLVVASNQICFLQADADKANKTAHGEKQGERYQESLLTQIDLSDVCACVCVRVRQETL